jgi:hypothetical protein
LPAEVWRTAPRGPLRVAIEYGDAIADPDGDEARLTEGLVLHAPPFDSRPPLA